MKWVDKKIFNLSFPVLFLKEKGRIFPDSRFFLVFSPGIDLRSMPGENRCFLRFRYFFLFRYFPRLRRSSGKTRPFSFRKRTRKRKKFAFFPKEKRTRNRRKTRFFHRAISWLGKKILAIDGSGKKSCLSFRFLWNRKNGRPLRFQRNLRGPGVGGNIEKRSVKKSEKQDSLELNQAIF